MFHVEQVEGSSMIRADVSRGTFSVVGFRTVPNDVDKLAAT